MLLLCPYSLLLKTKLNTFYLVCRLFHQCVCVCVLSFVGVAAHTQHNVNNNNGKKDEITRWFIEHTSIDYVRQFISRVIASQTFRPGSRVCVSIVITLTAEQYN